MPSTLVLSKLVCPTKRRRLPRELPLVSQKTMALRLKLLTHRLPSISRETLKNKEPRRLKSELNKLQQLKPNLKLSKRKPPELQLRSKPLLMPPLKLKRKLNKLMH
jgi:hypothetical protein